MTAGDIIRESLLVVEEVTVKTNEDIERGEVIYNDGNGFLAAAAGIANAKLYVALEEHDYSEESTHTIDAALLGCVEVQKVTGTAIKEGQKVMVGATAGEVNLFVKGDAPAGGASTYYTATIEAGVQTALDTNLGILGTCSADAASGDTTANVWVGVR